MKQSIRLETSKDVIEAGKKYMMPTYAQFPIVLTGGAGAEVHDMDGKTYLDFVAGIAVNALGYGDEELKKELNEVIEGGLTHCSNLYWNKHAVEAAELLSRLSGLEKTFFCNSGAEANEAALKLARKYGSVTKKLVHNKIISMEQSFHGRTYGAVTATGQEKYHKGFAPLMPNIEYAGFNDLDSVKKLIDDQTCAVLVEPIQGEGGIIPADRKFLTGLRELCDQHDLLLIFDEVQCGMGRTGLPFAYQQYGVMPDVLNLAKGLGAGIPIGAMVTGKRAAEVFSPGDHATTFGGSLIATAAASVVLRRLTDRDFLSSVQKSGALLRESLLDLQAQYPVITDTRGMGLIQGIELSCDAGSIVASAMEKGLLLVGAGKHVIRFVPPLTISPDEIRKAMDILQSVLAEAVPS